VPSKLDYCTLSIKIIMADVSPMQVFCFLYAALSLVFADTIEDALWGVIRAGLCLCFLKGIREMKRRNRVNTRNPSMQRNFPHAIQETAAIVHEHEGEESTENFESGVYQVELKETCIADKRTDDILCGGTQNRSILTLVVLHAESNGWSIKGFRKAENHYSIEEGFIAGSGKAYWVERSSEKSFLVCGDFIGKNSFSGEWLASDGSRGCYTEFHLVDPVEIPIVPSSEALTIV
jgi:hypothetical protein